MRSGRLPSFDPRLLTTRPRVLGCLRLADRVAQVRNADALNHRRIAKDGWRAGEVVKEPDPRAKKNRRDIDADLVEEASIQELLDGVGAVDPNVLPGRGGSY